MEGVQDIGEHEGDVVGQGLREHDGYSGGSRCTPCPVSQRSSSGVYTASVDQSRGVEDANLGKRLHTLYPPRSKHQHLPSCRPFSQAGHIGLTLQFVHWCGRGYRSCSEQCHCR